MKFFWKVFFSTILIAAAAFAVGGYTLIDSQFRAALGREVDAAYEENSLLYDAFEREFSDIAIMSDEFYAKYGLFTDNYAALDGDQITQADSQETIDQMRRESIWRAAQTVSGSGSRGSLHFRFADEAGSPIYSSRELALSGEPVLEIPAGSRGYALRTLGDAIYVHAARPLTLLHKTVYLETFRDVTALFRDRAAQFRRFQYLALAMIAATGVVVFFVSHWLTAPLGRLSLAARQIADGDLSQRVNAHGTDEIAALSHDFDAMTARLEAMVGELREASRRQEDFVASFAHELKTPLTSIIGYADMLRSKKLPEEQALLSANYIFAEGRRLEALSMKLLELIVTRRGEPVLRRVHTEDLFGAACAAVRPSFDAAGIELRAETEDAVLSLDADLIETVCVNLLDNARKATPRGGRVLFAGRRTPDGGFDLFVADTGKGMAPEELARITEPFYMVDKSRARAQGGAGLGLALCAEIVQLHGGTLDFESAPGQGTCARVHLKGGEGL